MPLRGIHSGNLLAEVGFPAHRVVVEVLEEAVRDTDEFQSAVDFFRELGCLIALDDFGAGSSNFEPHLENSTAACKAESQSDLSGQQKYACAQNFAADYFVAA